MGCRRKNTLCLSLDFGANDGTLLPRLTRLETSPSPQKRLVLKFPNICCVTVRESRYRTSGWDIFVSTNCKQDNLKQSVV